MQYSISGRQIVLRSEPKWHLKLQQVHTSPIRVQVPMMSVSSEGIKKANVFLKDGSIDFQSEASVKSDKHRGLKLSHKHLNASTL